MKRLLSLVLAFALVLSLLPGLHAHAEETPGEDPETPKLFQTQLEAIDYVRSMMVQRVEKFTVQLPMRLYYSGVLERILSDAMQDNGDLKAGDSLLWQTLANDCKIRIEDGYAYLHYSFTYLTTVQEEAELDAAIDALLEELSCNPSNKYETIKKVYDWICANVTYDDSSPYGYTAYGALVQRKASGYGYAVLMYQLMRKMGIACRVVPGVVYDMEHAWNLVGVGDYFYYVDAAWDAGLEEYECFLMGKSGLSDHSVRPNALPTGISISNINYADREDPCQTRGHDLVGGSCLEPKHCNRCGFVSEEYDRHYFLTGYDCEKASFCDTCKELILPTEHTYIDSNAPTCEMCGHRRRIVCMGENWSLDVAKFESSDKPYLELDPGVTATVSDEGPNRITYAMTFAGLGRYRVYLEYDNRERTETYDVHVIDHTATEKSGWCACFEKLQEDEHKHTWIEATCQVPRTCSECGETEGEPFSHDFYTPDCVNQPGVCYMCGLTQEAPPGHKYHWDSSGECTRCRRRRITTCTEGVAVEWLNSLQPDGFTLTYADPGLTITEGEYRLEGNIHCWQYMMTSQELGQYEVAFTDKATGEVHAVTVRIKAHEFVEGQCFQCGQRDPAVHFHSWVDATCTEPRTCSGCGLTDGFSRGHEWMSGSCTEPRHCRNCDLVIEVPSHYYSDDTDMDCNFCGRGRYVVCCGTEIPVVLSSIESGDFALKDTDDSITAALMEYFVADGVNYWEYVLYASEPGQYEVTMAQKDVEETLGVTLYVDDHLFFGGICWVCGILEGEHVHTWKSATCTKPAVCTTCGETEGHKLNHDFSKYSCSETAKCARCGEKRAKVAHTYDDIRDDYCNVCSRQRLVICEDDESVVVRLRSESKSGFRLSSPSSVSMKKLGTYSNWGYFEHVYEIKIYATDTYEIVLEDAATGEKTRFTVQKLSHNFVGGECEYCGKRDGTVHFHSWENATCDQPKTCKTCGATEGEPLEHMWSDATCFRAGYCYWCDYTEGEALGHDFVTWSCTQPGVCRRCNTHDETAAGHSYDSNTDDRCNRCDALRLVGCKDQALEITFVCNAEVPFTLVNPGNGVSMTLTSCEPFGDEFLQTYRISVSGKGTYELTCAREGEPNRESFTVLVLDHQYADGVCTFCGLEHVGLLGDVDGDGILTYNDALRILRASIQLETLDATQLLLADANQNGQVDYNDALMVLRISIGLS